MKDNLLILIISILLTFPAISFAVDPDPTLMESIEAFKGDAQDKEKIFAEQFSDRASSLYDRLSLEMDDLLQKNKLDPQLKGMQIERGLLKYKIASYKDAPETKKVDLRLEIIQKLENLDQRINEYNKTAEK